MSCPSRSGSKTPLRAPCVLRLLSLLGVLALLSAAVACSPGPTHKRLRLTTAGQAHVDTPVQLIRAPLRVAISSMTSPKETFKSYQDLLTYLGAQVDRPVELVQRKTYAEVNDLVRDGVIDLAFVCTGAYVEGQRDFGMEILAVPMVRGEARYRAYIIVPSDSLVQDLDQLQGRIFAFTDPDSNTGRLVPTYLLLQKGQTPEAFFRKVVYTYSHDNSIKAVADKLVDGASVDSLVYEYILTHKPELARRTKVIWRSDAFGAPPVIVHPSLNGELKARLREILLEMHTDPRGRTILDELLIDRFVEPEMAAYEPVREMLLTMRGQR